MFRNSDSSTGSSMYARNRTPRLRYAFIALLLVFNIASAGQAPAAQGAQGSTNSKFFMRIIDPKTTLCTGETHNYTVVVYSQFDTIPGTKGPRKTNPEPMEGVKIEAYPDPTSLGTFYDAMSTGKGGSVFAVTSGANSMPITAEFTFDAGKKPGKGNLIFQGIVEGYSIYEGYAPSVGYVSVPPLPVKVIPCKYKVKTLLDLNAQIYNINVISNDALMTADAAGNFTGSGTMYWVYSNYASLGCKLSLSASDSRVDLTGKLDDAGGQFGVTETFQPTKVSLIGTCPLASASKQAQGSVDPLIFQVASTGGVSTQTVTAQGISGTAHIVVVPEEDKAAAFNPDTLPAQIGWPSTWLTALRDMFPQMNNAALGHYR